MTNVKIVDFSGRVKGKRQKSTPVPWKYYHRYPDDFQRGTRQLSLAARGAYNDILDLIYMQGGPIPDDNRWICCALHCKPWEWRRVRKQLLATGKLVVVDGGITNQRAQEEIDERAAKAAKKAIQGPTRKGKRVLGENCARTGGELAKRPFLNEINGGDSTDTDTDTYSKKESPLPPSGGMDDRTAKGRTFWSGALNPTEATEVKVDKNSITLTGKTLDRWLAKFETRERLDLALTTIHIRTGSPEPIHRQVERALARQASEKLDRDQRYQAAARSNGRTALEPAMSTEEALAIINGGTQP